MIKKYQKIIEGVNQNEAKVDEDLENYGKSM
jgi:hypothetical protein